MMVRKASGTDAGNQSRRILIIEDEEFIRDLFKRKLETKGYTVFTATTAEAGFDILKTTRVDLVCLDVLLPMQDGFTFLKELKADERFQKIPVFILSNLGQEEEIQRGLALGAVDYIVKANVAPAEIVERIEAFFEGAARTAPTVT